MAGESNNSNELVFDNNEMVVEYWPGNELNPPDVRFEIDAHRVIYDRDYGTEEKVTGTHDLKRDEAEKLYYFLAEKFGFGATT